MPPLQPLGEGLCSAALSEGWPWHVDWGEPPGLCFLVWCKHSHLSFVALGQVFLGSPLHPPTTHLRFPTALQHPHGSARGSRAWARPLSPVAHPQPPAHLCPGALPVVPALLPPSCPSGPRWSPSTCMGPCKSHLIDLSACSALTSLEWTRSVQCWVRVALLLALWLWALGELVTSLSRALIVCQCVRMTPTSRWLGVHLSENMSG